MNQKTSVILALTATALVVSLMGGVAYQLLQPSNENNSNLSTEASNTIASSSSVTQTQPTDVVTTPNPAVATADVNNGLSNAAATAAPAPRLHHQDKFEREDFDSHDQGRHERREHAEHGNDRHESHHERNEAHDG